MQMSIREEMHYINTTGGKSIKEEEKIALLCHFWTQNLASKYSENDSLVSHGVFNLCGLI